METTDAQQASKKRRDTPAPSHLGPVGQDDELEEKAAAAVGLGDLVEVSMEEDGEDGDTLRRTSTDSSRSSARDSWTHAPPTIVQLPPRREKPQATTAAAAYVASVSVEVDGDEQFDAEVFDALPVELQEEILAERAAKLATVEAVEREKRDASLGSQGDSASRPEDNCWICRVCTFANHPQLAECEMCETLCFQPDELAFGAEQVEASPSSAGSRSRASSAGSELYAKLSQKLSSSTVSRSLKKIRLPATPAATKLTMKDDPTAEDLLLVATAKIQQLQSSASQTLTHAKQTIIARTNSGGRTSGLRLPSAVASSELGVLQRDLNRKCEAGDELYESLLKRLWNAVYQDAPVIYEQSADDDLAGFAAAAAPFQKREFARISDGWVDIGFQSSNPDTDFRGGGILALKCLVYVFEAFPQRMVEIAAAQKPAEGRKWYPVCVAGINLTCMIAGLLKLGNGEFDDTPAPHWKLFEEPSAFYQLFFYSAFLASVLLLL